MTTKTTAHTFHIPVMGLAFTVDSPIKVAQYGISSVVSIVDDVLIEKMNEFYSKKYQLPFQSYPTKELDSRAKRITSYLNLLHDQTEEKFNQLKDITSEKSKALKEYIHIS